MVSNGRAAIYSRISHDATGLELGVERQEADCFRLIAHLGYDLAIAPYRENDISASTRSRKLRPAYEEMLEAAQAGEFDLIVAYSTSRLTRRPSEFERLITLAERSGFRIETVAAGPVNLGSADGRALARLLAVMDAAEAERQSERVARALLHRRQRGLWCGLPPFGYRSAANPGTLTVDPEQARLVVEASRRFLEGETLAGICNSWNARGSRTKEGRLWYRSAITSMLRSPGPIGATRAGDELVPGNWSPILDRQSWDAIQVILADPRRYKRKANLEDPHPLTGLIHCGECGTVMSHQRSSKQDVFMCSSAKPGTCSVKIQIQTQQLERYLFEVIASHQPRRRALPTMESGRLQAELKSLLDRCTRLQDKYFDGGLDTASYKTTLGRLQARILDARLAAAAEGRSRNLPSSAFGPSLEDARTQRTRWLRESISSVAILPHPNAQHRPSRDWQTQSQLLSRRVKIEWLIPSQQD